MTEYKYLQALQKAAADAMREDERVIFIGSSETSLNPRVLREEFGTNRVWDAPVSEMAYAGAALGAALAGMRPIVSFGPASFMWNAWEQVINEAPHFRYMSGGQLKVPVVIHCTGGARGAGGSQHSHAPQAMLWNTPGLKIALPATSSDAYSLFRAAVADPNPVMVIDHAKLHAVEGSLDGADVQGLGRGVVRRSGSDVTVVATSLMLQYALTAAEELAREGIDVEVVDPRTLVPLDEEVILTSVRKTGRLVVADETHQSCGVAGEIAARVAEKAFGALRAPIRRVATADVPIPFSPALEPQVVPGPRSIAAAVRDVVAWKG